MLLKVRCDACNELIATIDPSTIKLPLKGHMFEASEQMYAKPFHPTNSFDDFRCPYGPHDYYTGHKPFFIEGEFLTENHRKWIVGEMPKDYPETPEERRQRAIEEAWTDEEMIDAEKTAWVEPDETGDDRAAIKAFEALRVREYPCRYCDKIFKHKSSRSRHEKECKLKKGAK